MKLQDLQEGTAIPCIVVDVQPSYTASPSVPEHMMHNWNNQLMDFLNNQNSPILMFVNAQDHGLTNDTISSIKQFWEQNGFDPDNWNRVQINDKGYGYFRSWMDSGIPDSLLIKTIREMYQYRHTDSRDLFDDENYSTEYGELMSAYLLANPNDEDTIKEDAISVEWTSLAQLKKFSGSYIMGGGREECLREVQLLMNAFNFKYRTIDKFVYG
jgi:hypothetical protein